MEKISIIVPIYNVEQYLEKCIISIINQTYKNIEIILVDDGSKDNSGKIADEYKKTDDRIVVIHKENGGLSDARNCALDIATGDYITFVDSDDYIDIRYCEMLYNALIKTNADIAICEMQYVYDDKYENNNNENIKTEEYLKGDAMIKYMDTEYVVACAKLYKSELFNDLRYIVGKIHEDEFMFHKVFFKCKKIVYINSKLYAYRQRESSITKTEYSIKKLDAICALEDRLKFSTDNKLVELYDKTEASYLYLLRKNMYQLSVSNIENKEKIIDELYSKLINRYSKLKKNKYISLKFYILSKIVALFPKTFKKVVIKKGKNE